MTQSLADIVESSIRDRLQALGGVITFSCNESLGFNACVTAPPDSAGIWHIEFGHDLVFGFHLLSQAALANSSCLLQIGDPGGERNWYGELEVAPDWGDPQAATRQVVAQVAGTDVRPTCRVRRAFAQRVWTHMLDFVLYHEFGHIWHGHLGPDQQRAELVKRVADGETDSDKEQAEEMHADAVAIIFGYKRAHHFRDESPDWLRAWGLGVSFAQYLLGLFDSPGSLTAGSHPHAAIRLVHARITSVAWPGFDLDHADWDRFSEDVVEVAGHLGIGSGVNPFMSERFSETQVEYTRMLQCFAETGGGLEPPKVLVDLMASARKSSNQ